MRFYLYNKCKCMYLSQQAPGQRRFQRFNSESVASASHPAPAKKRHEPVQMATIGRLHATAEENQTFDSMLQDSCFIADTTSEMAAVGRIPLLDRQSSSMPRDNDDCIYVSDLTGAAPRVTAASVVGRTSGSDDLDLELFQTLDRQRSAEILQSRTTHRRPPAGYKHQTEEEQDDGPVDIDALGIITDVEENVPPSPPSQQLLTETRALSRSCEATPRPDMADVSPGGTSTPGHSVTVSAVPSECETAPGHIIEVITEALARSCEPTANMPSLSPISSPSTDSTQMLMSSIIPDDGQLPEDEPEDSGESSARRKQRALHRQTQHVHDNK